VATVLREDRSVTRGRICSCGASAPECEFWGPVIEKLDHLPERTAPSDRYQLVLDRVENLYGRDIALVDSSKQVGYLKTLLEQVPDISLCVLHNIKDVRAFTISMLDNALRKDRSKAIPERIFFEWYRGNRRIGQAVNQLLGRSPARIMYEATCLATDAVTQHVAAALGEDYIDPAAELNAGNTHIISGNRLRVQQASHPLTLRYDHRWLVRSEWFRPYILLPMVRKYNEGCLREWKDVIL
jgi:hypothetical protein